MIRDIPTSDDFHTAAKAQFDFAWDIAISFLMTVEDAGDYTDTEINDEDREAFWNAANQRILTSVIVTQQGVELSLKARIAEVSPYLLIAGSSSGWPKDKDGDGLSFSEFRTIDAQDLISTINTAAEIELPKPLTNLYEKLRKLRNKAMHSVDNNLVVSADEVILYILELYSYLYPEEHWPVVRREFLRNSPKALLYFDSEHFEYAVIKEFHTVFERLNPFDVNRYFKINKKQRLYLCPECSSEASSIGDIEPFYAVLRPNEARSLHLYCFVCNGLHNVTRDSCQSEGCPGNVISADFGFCCTCAHEQEC